MHRTGLIILAAGGSTRLGSPKQLLPFDGRTFLRHAAETALASVCKPVVVVLGARAESFESELTGLPVVMVQNADWASGMGSSIRVGLQKIMSESPGQIDAVIFMVCDQPLIRPEDIDRLCSVHTTTGCGVVSSQYAESMGVPVLFSSRYFPELTALKPDEGAKRLIKKYQKDHRSISLPVGAFDVDTTEDYRKLLESKGQP